MTPVPDVALAVCVPRIAAIEYPLGQTLERPGDAVRQQAVLRATQQALETIQTPSGIVELPFVWSDKAEDQPGEPPEPPPIVGHILRHPWLLPRLLRRGIPESKGKI